MTLSDKTFYCLSCRQRVTADSVSMEQTQNGRYRLGGKCTKCHTKVSKFISDDKANSLKRMSSRHKKKSKRCRK
jgi:ferredoxin